MDEEGTLYAAAVRGAYPFLVSPGRVVRLPDVDRDGIADSEEVLLTGLLSPHGVEFWGGYLYVTERRQVTRYPFAAGQITGPPETIIDGLPTEGIHWSRTVRFGPDGMLYFSIGSTCDHCVDLPGVARIFRMNPDGTDVVELARGVRNAVGLDFHPVTGQLWATMNGRNLAGVDIPPDYVTPVQEGENYAWPLCFSQGGLARPDPQFEGRPIFTLLCRQLMTIPRFELIPHAAPLGLAFDGPDHLYMAYHGSHDVVIPPEEKRGYKVVRLNLLTGVVEDIINWLNEDHTFDARPVDILLDPEVPGRIFVSDDFGGRIFVYP